MKRIFVFAAVLAVAACGGAQPDAEQKENDNLRIKAEVAVEAKLRDPGSAQFEAFVSRISGEPVVCGTVNAKNAFGGYTGKQLYIYADGQALLSEEVVPETFSEIWSESCKPLTD